LTGLALCGDKRPGHETCAGRENFPSSKDATSLPSFLNPQAFRVVSAPHTGQGTGTHVGGQVLDLRLRAITAD